jgi:hypothetical protein
MTLASPDGQHAEDGVLDADGRLIEAGPRLAALHRSAGGRQGGMLAVPQVAALARLARRLGITVSRAAIAAHDAGDLELWVRAEPVHDRTLLTISEWKLLPAHGPRRHDPAHSPAATVREAWSWDTDESLRLTAISDPAERAHVGKPLTSLFRLREQDDGSLPILLALAERRRFEGQRAALRSNADRHFTLSGFPLVDGTGRFAGFHGSAEVEEQPEPKSQGAPAEPLRGPLGEIIAEAEAIGEAADGPLGEHYATYAGDIASAGRHLLSLVDDLGDLQAIEHADFSVANDPIDLALIARQAATLLAVRAAEGQVRLSAPPGDQASPATGDHRRVFQILVNLIGNAIRYSPPQEAVEIKVGGEGMSMFVSVTDRGKGIAAADQERVFAKFERVDPHEPGGTGLGLYIARRLARAMGGDIALASMPGLGARFTLTLPAAG